MSQEVEKEIEELSALILERLREALREPERVSLRRVIKTKEIRYENPDRPDKPTQEVCIEEEKLRRVKCPVDLGRLKQIAAILKELKEIRYPKTELDLQEQRARIAKLERESGTEAEEGELLVRFVGEAEELCL